MARLHLTVEGQTEQQFARRLLCSHLAVGGVYLLRIELAAHAKEKGQVHRGGLRHYLPFRNDIIRRLKEDKSGDVFLSTMIDLYALPDDFPGTDASKCEQDPYFRVERIEQALAADIGDPRFIPYVQLHEFEAVLFADTDKIAMYYEKQVREVEQLKVDVASFRSPELIDDGRHTAPSKRIAALIPVYAEEKTTAGPIIAAAIGLATIRNKCPHFDAWLQKLETLGQNPQ
jgi:hypothetical protein